MRIPWSLRHLPYSMLCVQLEYMLVNFLPDWDSAAHYLTIEIVETDIAFRYAAPPRVWTEARIRGKNHGTDLLKKAGELLVLISFQNN